jgi:hypothetical protein
MVSVNSSWARRAILLLALALPGACSDEAPTGVSDAATSTDARAGDSGAASDGSGDALGASAPIIECFTGVPMTNDELLNACWPETVTAISRKMTLPPGYKLGAQLPPPP